MPSSIGGGGNGGNGGVYSEDANSPLTISGSASGKYIIDGSYDIVKVYIRPDSTSTAGLEMLLNGVTSTDYYEVSEDGTSSNVSKITLSADMTSVGGELLLQATNPGSDIGFNASDMYKSDNRGVALSGKVLNVSGSLTSFTFQSSDGSNFDLTAEVRGMSV